VTRAYVALCLLLAACDAYAFAWDSSTGTVIVGFVDSGTSVGIVLEAPDTVLAGRAFDVTVNTFGSSSCVRAERLDVAVTGAVARLTPYDRVAPAGSPCTPDLGAHPHTASVTFAAPGTATLEVFGQAGTGDTIIRKTVVVH
jgi:hypothetical protein